MRLWAMFGLSALLLSCDNGDKSVTDTQVKDTQDEETFPTETDADGDGYSVDEDCDDSDPDLHPGQPELCNGIDDNCNNVIDEGFADTDNDAIMDCVDTEDCDGIDNDGDGQIDEDFEDTDGDGEANCGDEEEICNGIDDNGDGTVDEGFDVDGDGYTSCGDDKTPADCDDSDASINPDADEVDADSLDNDCDGQIDEGAWRIGDLFITEVMVNPSAVTDPKGEWFEIRNSSGHTVNLNGIIIGSDTDGDIHQISSSTAITLENGEFAVIAANGDVTTNGGVEATYVYGGDISMSNESDDLWLKVDEIVLDKITWDDGEQFPDPSGASIALDPDYFSSALNDLPEGWCQAIRPWSDRSDLGYPNETNYICRPIASAVVSTTGTLYTCTEFTLDGTASETVPGTDLEYAWELVSAPSSSETTTATLEGSDTDTATFMPDEAGTYTFSLTAYNGYEYSEPATVTVTVVERPYNADPTADAGPDESYSEDSVCWPVSYGSTYSCNDCGEQEFELDGTGSSDADGDWFTYSWAITSGETYASIEDEETSTPTVTVSGVGTTYGSNTTVTVEVTLTTTDCMGAEGTDTVDLSYTCKGS